MKKKVQKVFRIVAEVWIEPNTESDKYLKAVIKENLEGGYTVMGENQEHNTEYKWSVKNVHVTPLVLRIK